MQCSRGLTGGSQQISQKEARHEKGKEDRDNVFGVERTSEKVLRSPRGGLSTVQKFCVTPVLDHGRQYFMVNWPGKREP
jgi:hypothetical protein